MYLGTKGFPAGKTQEEAVMLLNHKYALRFILDKPEYLEQLSVSYIEDIHQLLTKGLSVDSIDYKKAMLIF